MTFRCTVSLLGFAIFRTHIWTEWRTACPLSDCRVLSHRRNRWGRDTDSPADPGYEWPDPVSKSSSRCTGGATGGLGKAVVCNFVPSLEATVSGDKNCGRSIGQAGLIQRCCQCIVETDWRRMCGMSGSESATGYGRIVFRTAGLLIQSCV